MSILWEECIIYMESYFESRLTPLDSLLKHFALHLSGSSFPEDGNVKLNKHKNIAHKLELWQLFVTTCLYAYHVASTIHPPEYRNLSLKEVVCGSQTKKKIMFWHVTDCTHLVCQFWAGSKYPDKKLHFLKTNVDLCFVTSPTEEKHKMTSLCNYRNATLQNMLKFPDNPLTCYLR